MDALEELRRRQGGPSDRQGTPSPRPLEVTAASTPEVGSGADTAGPSTSNVNSRRDVQLNTFIESSVKLNTLESMMQTIISMLETVAKAVSNPRTEETATTSDDDVDDDTAAHRLKCFLCKKNRLCAMVPTCKHMPFCMDCLEPYIEARIHTCPRCGTEFEEVQLIMWLQ